MSIQMRMVPLDKLQPNPANPRYASEDALARLKTSIERFGFVEPIIVWKNEQGGLEIVAGHQRYDQAKAAGLAQVPVIVYPFPSRKDATAYNIASNRLGELSEWDFTKLKDNLELLDDGEFPLELTGFNVEERRIAADMDEAGLPKVARGAGRHSRQVPQGRRRRPHALPHPVLPLRRGGRGALRGDEAVLLDDGLA